MKVSLAMSTYCGEKYIVEQLDSIKNQTYKIDEVIISDDCSTDSTVKIIEKYISDNNLDNWKLIKNNANKGWKKNFKEVIEKTTGDIVFLADQDDIWDTHKIDTMIKIMASDKDIELLACEYFILQNDSIKNCFANNRCIENLKLHKKFFYVKRPGCAYAVSRKLIDELAPYWQEDLPHDQQLWMLSYVRNSLYILHENLFKYRRHDETATGIRNGFSLKDKLQNLYYEENSLALVIKYDENNNLLNKSQRKMLNMAYNYALNRKKYLTEKHFMNFFVNIRYLNYYAFYRTFVGDIFAKLKK